MTRREDDASRAAAPLPAQDRSPSVQGMHNAIAREQAEPADGREPVPMAWLMGILVLAMFSGWYMGTFSYAFAPEQLDGSPPRSLFAEAGPAPQIDPLVQGRRIYNSCMACHQQDGRGISGQFPPLAGSEWVLGEPDALVRILLHGLQGPIVVGEQTYNGAMPAWPRLDDQQVASVLTYIRGAWGNDAPAVAADLVATGRRAIGEREGPWSADDLRAAAPLQRQ